MVYSTLRKLWLWLFNWAKKPVLITEPPHGTTRNEKRLRRVWLALEGLKTNTSPEAKAKMEVLVKEYLELKNKQ